MTGLRTFWRRFGGLLAICLAFTLVVAPAADAAVCSDDVPSAAAVHADDLAQVSSSSEHDQNSGGDIAGHCLHGHCHHGGSVPPSLATEVAAHEIGSTPAPRLQSQLVRSRASARLERPPRG